MAKRTKSNALARIREERGWTQESLARESDVSIKTIQIWERVGTSNAKISNLSKVAGVLGVDINDLIC